jgi:ssDNA-binding Zn-finger/Zn-ribbon topoisomerase 1
MEESQKQTYKAYPVVCPECNAPMRLINGKYGLFYGCIKFPNCSGAHKAHPDGRPVGEPATKEVKDVRVRVHGLLNLIWNYDDRTGRSKMYAWLARNTSSGHVSQLTLDELLVLETKLQRMVKV